MSGRPINEDRQNAIALGLRTYTGSVHSRCGTTERYVSGGSCVHCARVIATEQREARKYLKAHAEPGYAEQEALAAGYEPLDISEEMVLESDDAEARRQAAIDELM